MPLQLCLSRVRGEEREQRAQVGEVEERQALLIRVVEHQAEALLLRLVRLKHLGQQRRAEVGTRRAHRHARPDAAEGQVLDRETRPAANSMPRSAARLPPGRQPLPVVDSPEGRP